MAEIIFLKMKLDCVSNLQPDMVDHQVSLDAFYAYSCSIMQYYSEEILLKIDFIEEMRTT